MISIVISPGALIWNRDVGGLSQVTLDREKQMSFYSLINGCRKMAMQLRSLLTSAGRQAFLS